VLTSGTENEICPIPERPGSQKYYVRRLHASTREALECQNAGNDDICIIGSSGGSHNTPLGIHGRVGRGMAGGYLQRHLKAQTITKSSRSNLAVTGHLDKLESRS